MNTATVEASSYLDFGGRGWCAVICGERQHCYPLPQIPDVLSALPTVGDAYLSQQVFYKPSRRLVHLQQLGVCYVDLETHKSEYRHLKPEPQAMALRLFCQDSGLPVPTLINYSGRGLHVKWCFLRPIPAQALPRWNAVERAFCDALKPFCPDRAARDGSRCLRIAGSINPRSRQECRTVWHDGPRWDFETLAYELLPFTREELQAKKKADKERAASYGVSANLWSPQQLWWFRLADVRKLIELRGWQAGVPTGYRDAFLFIATCAVAWSVQPADLPAEVEALAMELCPTLSMAEVRAYTGTAIAKAKEGKPYRFRSERIIEFLDIQPDEQPYLKTLIDDHTRESRTAEYDRQRHRKFTDRSTYEANAQALREQARSLREQGLSYKAIAVRMERTVHSVDKLLRYQDGA